MSYRETVEKMYTNRKWILLSLGMIFSFLLSIYLWISPILEQKKVFAMQTQLLNHLVLDSETHIHHESIIVENPKNSETESIRGASFSDTPVSLNETDVSAIGILFIDSINVALPVTEGVSDAQLKIAVGHIPQTASIGNIGNAVIAGHRSYRHGHLFNRLGELTGDEIIRYEDTYGNIFKFKVFDILVISPDDSSAFEQPIDESIITLYTCTPIQTATSRLLIRARLIH